MPALAKLRALAAAALISAAALPASAQPTSAIQDFKADQSFSGILGIAGKQVPLPEGDWRLAGYKRMTVEGSRFNFGAYGVIHNLVLFRTSGRNVDAVLDLNVNAIPVTDGWGVSKECSREDLYAVISRYKSGWDASCIFILHTQTPAADKASPAWSDATAYARTKNLNLPPSWVTAGFRMASRSDVVDARFSFNPATRGLQATNGAWDQSPWHKSKFESDPAKVAFVSELARWVGPYASTIEQGMKNRLLVRETYPMPFSSKPPVEAAVATARLKTLDKLYAENGIPEDSYKAQREQIVSGKATEPLPQPDAPTIALWKTLAYRPMVSTANIFIDYYWIGQPFAAGVLVVLQVVVNTTKFYFHEIAWERFVGGASGKRDAPLVVDFTYAALTS